MKIKTFQMIFNLSKLTNIYPEKDPSQSKNLNLTQSPFYLGRSVVSHGHGTSLPYNFTYFFRGFVHLGAGLSVGLSGLAAGYAIGVVGDAGVRGTAQQPRLFVGMILILIFAEVLGLYGLIVAIYLYAKK